MSSGELSTSRPNDPDVRLSSEQVGDESMPDPQDESAEPQLKNYVDETSAESFPASDPPSWAIGRASRRGRAQTPDSRLGEGD